LKKCVFQKFAVSSPHLPLFQAQNDLLTEGFSRKAEEMKAEIKHLRNIIEKSKKDKASWISKTLDGLATEATAILSLPAKVIGWGLKGLSSLFK